MIFQLLDLAEVYVHDQSHIVLFGRDTNGELVQVRVTDTPVSFSWAVAPDFSDAMIDRVFQQLRQHLLRSTPRCRRALCECNGGAYGVYREPCMATTKLFGDPLVSWGRPPRARGFDIAERDDRDFVRFVLRYPFMIHEATRFVANHELGKRVPAAMRGIYDCFKVAVDAFLIGKELASFDWIDVPALDVTYTQVRKVDVKAEATFTLFCLDIEVISTTYREEETKQAAYPVGLISCHHLGKFISFMLRAPEVEHEVYRHDTDQASAIAALEGETPVVKDLDDGQIDDALSPEQIQAVVQAHRVQSMLDLERERVLLRIPFDTVLYFDTEEELLGAFRDFFLLSDPDVVTGYNSNYYDIPYLMRRSRRLGVPRFEFLSRLEDQPLVLLIRDKTTNQAGTREQILIDCPGRIFLDLFPVCQTALKLESYTLSSVAQHFKLGGKADVGYTDIHPYFHGTPVTRLALLRYCIRDVHLTVQIERKMDVFRKLVAKSRVLRTRARDALDRGLGYVLSMMVRAKIRGRYCLPAKTDDQLRPAYDLVSGYRDLYEAARKHEKYEGAFVFEPIVGVRDGVVITQDFSSLYPSIAMTHNICHSTLVPRPTQASWYGPDDVFESPSGFWFLKPHVRQGELPRVWGELLDQRKAVRSQMALLKRQGGDPDQLAMLDAEQGELKIAANSLYGQLGALSSDLCLLAGAISITAWGKFYIQNVQRALEQAEEFKPWGLRVAYGDTDSLMIELQRVTDRDEGVKHGERIQRWINHDSGLLHGHLRMEFENVSYKTYFNAKKCYVKVLRDETDGTLYLKKSGLGKRDMTKYNACTVQTILEMALLNHRTPQDVADYFRRRCARLLQRRLDDLSLLQHTTQVSKHLSEYATPPIHIRAALMLQKAGMQVRVGDRVTYYKCMTGRINGKVSDAGVPKELFQGGYELDMPLYVQEMVGIAEKKLVDFFPGDTPAERLVALRHAAWDNPRLVPAIFRCPTHDFSTGGMDQFVHRDIGLRTTRTPPVMIRQGVYTQLNLHGEPLTLRQAAALVKPTRKKTKTERGTQLTLDKLFS